MESDDLYLYLGSVNDEFNDFGEIKVKEFLSISGS